VICPLGVLNNTTQAYDKTADIPIIIDGNKINEPAKKLVIKRFKKDNIQVHVPVVTYLPLKSDDLPN
jgi:hypothetical protein